MPTEYFIGRYQSDGAPDPEFGDAGFTRVPVSDSATKVHILHIDPNRNVTLRPRQARSTPDVTPMSQTMMFFLPFTF